MFPVDAVEAGKASCARAQLVSYILFWTIKHADLEQGLNDAMYNLIGQLQGLVMARDGPDQLIAHKLLTCCHERAGSVCYVLPFLALTLVRVDRIEARGPEATTRQGAKGSSGLVHRPQLLAASILAACRVDSPAAERSVQRRAAQRYGAGGHEYPQ